MALASTGPTPCSFCRIVRGFTSKPVHGTALKASLLRRMICRGADGGSGGRRGVSVVAPTGRVQCRENIQGGIQQPFQGGRPLDRSDYLHRYKGWPTQLGPARPNAPSPDLPSGLLGLATGLRGRPAGGSDQKGSSPSCDTGHGSRGRGGWGAAEPGSVLGSVARTSALSRLSKVHGSSTGASP